MGAGRIPAAAHAVIEAALVEAVHVGSAAGVVLLAHALAPAEAKFGVLGLPFPAHLLLACHKRGS